MQIISLGTKTPHLALGQSQAYQNRNHNQDWDDGRIFLNAKQ